MAKVQSAQIVKLSVPSAARHRHSWRDSLARPCHAIARTLTFLTGRMARAVSGSGAGQHRLGLDRAPALAHGQETAHAIGHGDDDGPGLSVVA